MCSRAVSPYALHRAQGFNDLRLQPLPRVPRILDPPGWDVRPKLDESPDRRTDTGRKELGFTWHGSSSPRYLTSNLGNQNPFPNLLCPFGPRCTAPLRLDYGHSDQEI